MPLSAPTLQQAIFTELRMRIPVVEPVSAQNDGLQKLAAAIATGIVNYFATTQVQVDPANQYVGGFK